MIPLGKALRIASSSRIALVGAGGKTRLMFCLARSYPARSVLVTTTTHLGVAQADLADQHFLVESPGDLQKIGKALPAGILLLTGPPIPGEGRLSGVTPKSLAAINDLAQSHQIPLLVEADGSRQRPLKAPGDHEPAVPGFVDTVLVVAGLSAIGQPLSDTWVHRPEIFSSLSGLGPGRPISPEGLSRVLISPAGGLKRIPAGARRVVCLTQVSTPDRQAIAADLSADLLKGYDAVLALDLNTAPASRLPPMPQVHAVYERIAGIILAAGGSSRFEGGVKQLLDWQGEPLVRKIAQTALQADLDPVIVVTGSSADKVRPALDGLPISIVENKAWEQGQGTSVQAGVLACPDQVGGAVFLLVDQPQIPAMLLRSLVEAHSRSLTPLAVPQIDGQRGNPVLFDRETFPELKSLAGEQGGRALFSQYRKEWVPWHDTRMLLDIDTVEDYRRLLREMFDPVR